MLPIRLGMVNANGPQELFVYALTRNGRVETTNYRTVKLPADIDVPLYVNRASSELLQGDVRAAGREGERPRGVPRVRLGHELVRPVRRRSAVERRAAAPRRLLARRQDGRAPNVFLTRLHVRYDSAHFPEDLVFQETGDRANFQGRYVLRHAWTGGETCAAAADYRRALRDRHAREAEQLARLTGWNITDIRQKMGPDPAVPAEPAWWERIWRK